MNVVGEYWKALGQAIATGRRDNALGGEGFAEIATEALRALPAPQITATAIADWMIEDGSLPEQVNIHSSFGEPPLVVHANDDFYIEVLFWFPGRTPIHGHGFSGAFVVLDGLSIQTEFAFHEQSKPDEGVRLGTLEPRSVEFIEAGKVCAISAGDAFVHTVAHLGNPSLTLVVRTYSEPKQEQFRYHRCGFAVRPSRGHLAQRHAEVLKAVHDAVPEQLPARLKGLLARTNDRQFFWVLMTMLSSLRGSIFAQDVLPVIEAEYAGARPDAVAAIRESLRTLNIWSKARSFPKLATQVQCALADVFPDAAEREALLCRSHGVSRLSDLPQPCRDLVLGLAPLPV